MLMYLPFFHIYLTPDFQNTEMLCESLLRRWGDTELGIGDGRGGRRRRGEGRWGREDGRKGGRAEGRDGRMGGMGGGREEERKRGRKERGKKGEEREREREEGIGGMGERGSMTATN